MELLLYASLSCCCLYHIFFIFHSKDKSFRCNLLRCNSYELENFRNWSLVLCYEKYLVFRFVYTLPNVISNLISFYPNHKTPAPPAPSHFVLSFWHLPKHYFKSAFKSVTTSYDLFEQSSCSVYWPNLGTLI